MIQVKKKSVCISRVRTSDSSFSDNVVANLQKQIDANKTAITTLSTTKVNISDKATEEQAAGGSDNTKWMTPYLVKKEIGSVTGEWKTFLQKNGNISSEYTYNKIYNLMLFTLPAMDQPGELDFTEILKARKVKETLKFTTNPTIIISEYDPTISLGGIFLGSHDIGPFGNGAGSTVTVNLIDFSWIYETPIYIDWYSRSGIRYHFKPSGGDWGLNDQKRLSFSTVGPQISFSYRITQIQNVGFEYKLEYML